MSTHPDIRLCVLCLVKKSPGLPSARLDPALWIALRPERRGSAVEQLWAAAGSEAAAWLLPLQVGMLTQKGQS